MAEETTTSKKPSLKQIVETIRNTRRDLDGLENLMHTLANQRGTFDLVADAMLNAKWRMAEARMWLGRALAELGEQESEHHDKADEERTLVAPGRRQGDDKTGKGRGKGRKN